VTSRLGKGKPQTFFYSIKLFDQIKNNFQQHLQIIVFTFLDEKNIAPFLQNFLKDLRHTNIFTVLNFHFEEGSLTRRWE
jgi:hypothetical protein